MIERWGRAILHATGAIGSEIVFVVLGTSILIAGVVIWFRVHEKIKKEWIAHAVSVVLILILLAFFFEPVRIMSRVVCGSDGSNCS